MPTQDVLDAVMLHYQLQHGTYFDTVVQTRSAIVAASSVPGYIWNHTAVHPGGETPNEQWVIDARRHLDRLNRPLAIYVERSMDADVGGLFAGEGLAHVDTEAWMFLDGRVIVDDEAAPGLVLTVPQGSDELSDVYDLVSRCFDVDHAEAIRAEAPLGGAGRLGQRFLLECEGTPVGAATVLYRCGWAVLHDICILPEFRGRDFGFELVNRVLAIVAGTWSVVGVFLQCDGGRLEEFYGRCGFETRYVRHGYSAEAPT